MEANKHDQTRNAIVYISGCIINQHGWIQIINDLAWSVITKISSPVLHQMLFTICIHQCLIHHATRRVIIVQVILDKFWTAEKRFFNFFNHSESVSSDVQQNQKFLFSSLKIFRKKQVQTVKNQTNCLHHIKFCNLVFQGCLGHEIQRIV